MKRWLAAALCGTALAGLTGRVDLDAARILPLDIAEGRP